MPALSSLTLQVKKVGNTVVLNWPATAGAYLQSTPTLNPAAWAGATDQFSLAGSQAQVTVAPLNGNRYFRLQVMP